MQLKAGLVQRIDEAALTWTEQEKEACFESTIAETFQVRHSFIIQFRFVCEGFRKRIENFIHCLKTAMHCFRINLIDRLNC